MRKQQRIHFRQESCLDSQCLSERAFSLVELLVAVTVLAIIGILIAQVTIAVSRTARLGSQGVDAAAQARIAFDRIGMDVANGIFRPDVDFLVSSTNASDTSLLNLLSGVTSADHGQGGFTNRRASIVSYRMAKSQDNNGRICLLRAGRAIGWNESGFMGLNASGIYSNYPISFSSAAFPAQPSDAQYDVLSPAVIQAVVGFRLRPDNEPVQLADGTLLANARGQIVYSPPMRGTNAPASSYVDAKRIGALLVGLVVIDPERLKLLDADTAAQLSAAFATVPSAGELPISSWMESTSNLASLPSSVPLPVRQSVRLYQRAFPLPSQ